MEFLPKDLEGMAREQLGLDASYEVFYIARGVDAITDTGKMDRILSGLDDEDNEGDGLALEPPKARDVLERSGVDLELPQGMFLIGAMSPNGVQKYGLVQFPLPMIATKRATLGVRLRVAVAHLRQGLRALVSRSSQVPA